MHTFLRLFPYFPQTYKSFFLSFYLHSLTKLFVMTLASISFPLLCVCNSTKKQALENATKNVFGGCLSSSFIMPVFFAKIHSCLFLRYFYVVYFLFILQIYSLWTNLSVFMDLPTHIFSIHTSSLFYILFFFFVAIFHSCKFPKKKILFAISVFITSFSLLCSLFSIFCILSSKKFFHQIFPIHQNRLIIRAEYDWACFFLLLLSIPSNSFFIK